jgi:hypothetical protein
MKASAKVARDSYVLGQTPTPKANMIEDMGSFEIRGITRMHFDCVPYYRLPLLWKWAVRAGIDSRVQILVACLAAECFARIDNIFKPRTG